MRSLACILSDEVSVKQILIALILAVSLAVERHLTVDHVAQTFSVYPSLSGSVTEAARKLMQPAELDPLI